jgi:hypothetical protein
MRPNHPSPGLWPGLLLISLGGGLLAREFGLLPPTVRVVDFWPLFVMLIGVSVLLRAQGVVSAVLALAFIGTGGVLLAGNLGFLTFSATRLWPVLLVLLGVAALFRRGGPHPGGPHPRGPFPPRRPGSWTTPEDGPSGMEQNLRESTDQDRINRQFTCSGGELRIESQAWKGGELGVTAGGVELDLRHAQLAPEGAVLNLRIMMGGVEIRVPDTWQVFTDVHPLFGGADNTTRSTQGAESAPRLRIVGSVTLGGVSVRN